MEVTHLARRPDGSPRKSWSDRYGEALRHRRMHSSAGAGFGESADQVCLSFEAGSAATRDATALPMASP